MPRRKAASFTARRKRMQQSQVQHVARAPRRSLKLENAQLMAAHESPRTTKLYDRTGDEITLDEVERIAI